MNWSTFKTADLISKGALEIGDGYRAKNSEMAKEGVPFVRAGDVVGRVNTNGTDLLSIESVEKVGRKRSMTGDVVMTTKGTIGRLAFVKDGDPEFIYSPQLCFWRSLDNDLIHPRWLFYAMRSQEMLSQISWSAGQTDMAPYVSLTDQRTEFEITLPTIHEQHEIAAILGALDDKIELNRKSAATLEEIERTLFRSWFVDYDPVWAKIRGLDPSYMDAESAALFPCLFGEDGLPKGWVKEPLSKFFKSKNERAGNVRYREFSSSNQGIHPRDEKYKKQLSKDTSKNKIAKRGDFVFGLSRKVLNFGMMQQEIGAFSPAYRVYAVERGYDFSLFVYEYMKLFPEYFYQAVSASSREGQAISENSLLSLEVLDPPSEVLSAYVILTKPLKDALHVLSGQSQTLADLRDTLLPRLTSGELSVGVARKQVEDVA
ncbi:restriction endonuclease subunit S [Ruegeria arenilitoris]|uniref:restriction endonuclease subunit S n=1 Tax=Ruegeria arenilitoris TaxID=1173585 RepID=UPI00147F5D4E|nr:restriction endonuclease subunit S [Ruegeria arenilitoris]